MSLYLQISGHKPRHAGSGLSILTAYLPKGKLKILITDIDLLYKEVPGMPTPHRVNTRPVVIFWADAGSHRTGPS